MTKVYQTIIDKSNGNCMQAVIASLFDLTLEEMPGFKVLKDGWFSEFWNFLHKHNYEYEGCLYNYLNNKRLYSNDKSEDRFHELKYLKGINGYFYAVVYSPKYYNSNDNSPTTHAVIIDKNFSIIHDPNPNNINIKYPLADEIRYNGILTIFMIEPKN